MHSARLGVAHVELGLGARDSDVTQAALLFQAGQIVCGHFVREEPFFHA